LSRFECFSLFRVNNHNIWEYFRELFSIENLRSFLLVPSVIYIKCLSIILKNLFEFPDISRHIQWRRVHKKNGFACFPICIFEFSPELLEIRIKCKLYIECSWETLIEDILCEFLSLDSFCCWKQGIELFRLNKGRVHSKFVTADSFEGLKVVKINVFLHVLLEAIDKRGLIVSVELAWFHS